MSTFDQYRPLPPNEKTLSSFGPLEKLKENVKKGLTEELHEDNLKLLMGGSVTEISATQARHFGLEKLSAFRIQLVGPFAIRLRYIDRKMIINIDEDSENGHQAMNNDNPAAQLKNALRLENAGVNKDLIVEALYSAITNPRFVQEIEAETKQAVKTATTEQ